MPVSPTYPGVYVNELPNPVMPIVGVPTSVTAFVGPATMGQTDYPVQCNSWSDYENTFGSLDPTVPLSYAVYMFYPQSQIDLGIVNILVGFAPLKPAEFVIINIQQQAGQS